MLKAIIIDDEAGARRSLAAMLEARCSNVRIVAMADSVQSGIDAIRKERPALVFLDIHLKEENSFQLLEALQPVDFEIIFTTAYDQYALRAIKFAALDYLLKPIDSEELAAAVSKAEKKIGSRNNNHHLSAFINNHKEANIHLQTVGLPTQNGFIFVQISEIIRCQSDDTYTVFYIAGNKKLIVSRLLKDFEEMLAEAHFFRTHQSHLVNLKHIKEYVKGEGGELLMSDQSVVPVSKRKKEELLQKLRISR